MLVGRSDSANRQPGFLQLVKSWDIKKSVDPVRADAGIQSVVKEDDVTWQTYVYRTRIDVPIGLVGSGDAVCAM